MFDSAVDTRLKMQTIFFGDVQGRKGNCTQAAIATLLDLPLDDVPDFNNQYPRDDETSAFWDAIREFFALHGMDFQHCSGITDHRGLYLAAGPTARGTLHMVVYKDGRLFWDPHPSKDGLLAVRHTWRCVPFDASQMIRR